MATALKPVKKSLKTSWGNPACPRTIYSTMWWLPDRAGLSRGEKASVLCPSSENIIAYAQSVTCIVHTLPICIPRYLSFITKPIIPGLMRTFSIIHLSNTRRSTSGVDLRSRIIPTRVPSLPSAPGAMVSLSNNPLPWQIILVSYL